jgi:hypothetical protein
LEIGLAREPQALSRPRRPPIRQARDRLVTQLARVRCVVLVQQHGLLEELD